MRHRVNYLMLCKLHEDILDCRVVTASLTNIELFFLFPIIGCERMINYFRCLLLHLLWYVGSIEAASGCKNFSKVTVINHCL